MSSPFADQILTADPPEADAALSLLLLIKGASYVSETRKFRIDPPKDRFTIFCAH